MTKRVRLGLIAVVAIIIFGILGYVGFRVSYRRPYRSLVEESEMDANLVYAVMKAESSFNENARSGAGAVGIMQLMPATAEFICELKGVEFDSARLCDGEYNVKLGCLYLCYLFERFSVTETVLCAFNAGEGTVSEWLQNDAYSFDGLSLHTIPYAETRNYVKKVMNFRKIYDFFY